MSRKAFGNMEKYRRQLETIRCSYADMESSETEGRKE
jgi:hypothetical protein